MLFFLVKSWLHPKRNTLHKVLLKHFNDLLAAGICRNVILGVNTILYLVTEIFQNVIVFKYNYQLIIS